MSLVTSRFVRLFGTFNVLDVSEMIMPVGPLCSGTIRENLEAEVAQFLTAKRSRIRFTRRFDKGGGLRVVLVHVRCSIQRTDAETKRM
jgi:hypothetical protein